MNKKITKNGNETIVKIFEGKNIYTGKAKVHPDDVNFATDRVGSYIAESRARIKRHNKKARETAMNIDELKSTANEVRKGILTAVHSAKAGHPGATV